MATLKRDYLSGLVLVAAMTAALWVVACGSGSPEDAPGGTGGPTLGSEELGSPVTAMAVYALYQNESSE